jgi:hypothetical protein
VAAKKSGTTNADRKGGKAWKKHPKVFDKAKRRLVSDVPK